MWRLGAVITLSLSFSVTDVVASDHFSLAGPRAYWPGESLRVSTGSIYTASHKAQLHYNGFAGACMPHHAREDGISFEKILSGDRRTHSDMTLPFLVDRSCVFLCERALDQKAIAQAVSLIKANSLAEWFLDGLVGGTPFLSVDKRVRYMTRGFSLGQVTQGGLLIIFNHFDIVIQHRPSDHHDASKVLLAFEVYPRSWQSQGNRTCPAAAIGELETNPGIQLNQGRELLQSLSFNVTYSVYFRENLEIYPDTRWRPYFAFSGAQEDRRRYILVSAITSILMFTMAVISFRQVRRLSISLEDLQTEKGFLTDVHTLPSTMPHSTGVSVILGTGIFLCSTIPALLANVFDAHANNTRPFSPLSVLALSLSGISSGYTFAYFQRDWIVLHSGESALRHRMLLSMVQVGVVLPIIGTCDVLLYNALASLQELGSPFRIGQIFSVASSWCVVCIPSSLIGAAWRLRQGLPADISTLPEQKYLSQNMRARQVAMKVAAGLPLSLLTLMHLFSAYSSTRLHQEGSFAFLSRSLLLSLGQIMVLTFLQTLIRATQTIRSAMLKGERPVMPRWQVISEAASPAVCLSIAGTLWYMIKLRYGWFAGGTYFLCLASLCAIWANVSSCLAYMGTWAIMNRLDIPT